MRLKIEQRATQKWKTKTKKAQIFKSHQSKNCAKVVGSYTRHCSKMQISIKLKSDLRKSIRSWRGNTFVLTWKKPNSFFALLFVRNVLPHHWWFESVPKSRSSACRFRSANDCRNRICRGDGAQSAVPARPRWCVVWRWRRSAVGPWGSRGDRRRPTPDGLEPVRAFATSVTTRSGPARWRRRPRPSRQPDLLWVDPARMGSIPHLAGGREMASKKSGNKQEWRELWKTDK